MSMSGSSVASTAGSDPAARQNWREALAVYLRRDVLIVLFLGFSAGLPLALSGSTLLVWMSEAGVNLRTIGLFSIVGTPYTLKFLWAPLIDALRVPVLCKRFGRRRGWLLFAQMLLMAAILFLGTRDPAGDTLLVALGAVLVAFASATQDIVIDTYRVEKLDDSEQAAGMAAYVGAYRVGMLVSTAGALYIVQGFEALGGLSRLPAWQASYAVMAAFVCVGFLAVLAGREPQVAAPVTTTEGNPLKRILRTAFDAFAEFFQRDLALAVLAFVVLFKLCDALAGHMIPPFVIHLGFERIDYANYVKGVGLIATLLGGFFGGFLARALPLVTCLWIGGLVQTLSNLSFSALALAGKSHLGLALAITAENFAGAIGTVMFVAYLSKQCRSIAHTATQFALLTAFASFARTYLVAPGGYMVEWFGWFWFFVVCCFTALPAFAVLAFLQHKGHFAAPPAPEGTKA